jgi:predicted nucleotide-binding protein (sugar kinase/HSP70/actin superfamily)
MATVKLGMKQGLQESRYPISLTHGYNQIGDETGSTRIKVPNTTAQRRNDVMENYLFICKMFGTLKKAPGVLQKKYPKEVLETCKERNRCP